MDNFNKTFEEETILGKHTLGYDVDVVFCIDRSENMCGHLDRVKEWIPEFCDKISNYFHKTHRKINHYRAKIIAFSDYRIKGRSAVEMTSFFDLESEKDVFINALQSVDIHYGCTKSVCGLEALAYATYSDWSTEMKTRRYVVVFSNSETNSLEDSTISAFHPKDMPKSTKEFLELWSKRLNDNYSIFLLTPYEKDWNIITRLLYSIHFPSAAGDGLKESKTDYDHMFDSIPLGFD